MDREYLVSYGSAGDFGRFRPVGETAYRRGDRVVVRSHQGLDIGVVLCPATAGHARFLSKTALGELLRRTTEEDERTAEQVRELGQRLFEDGRRRALELGLPLEILDVDVFLDGQQAVVQHLSPPDCDYRPVVSFLSRRHNVLIVMQNLALPKQPGGDGEQGCGRPDCGRANGGSGCTTCGSGNGCGTCGKATKKEDVADYLLGLRHKMEQDAARVSLL